LSGIPKSAIISQNILKKIYPSFEMVSAAHERISCDDYLDIIELTVIWQSSQGYYLKEAPPYH